MAVDINRVVASAIEAALDDDDHHEPEHRSRHRGLKTLAAGAALVATARVVASQAPKLGGLAALSKLTQLPDTLREKLADLEFDGGDYDEQDEDDDVEDDDEFEDYELEDEVDGDDGPDDEGGDGPDGEEDEGGGGGDDADVEEEPEEDEDEPAAAVGSGGSAVEQAAQGLDIGANGHSASRSTEIDPVGRPPEPPTQTAEKELHGQRR